MYGERMEFEVLKYVNDPHFCKCYSKYCRLRHGLYLLCLFQIQDKNIMLS